MDDFRLRAPATERNRDPILGVLRGVLPAEGLVLEVASGTGEHAVYFARHFPPLAFQPSDPDDTRLKSIDAWIKYSRLANIRPPVKLDAASDVWPLRAADAILCINMIHISPWRATEGLMRGAAKFLATGAPLYLYGPYRRAGIDTAPSNEAFDADLKSRNAEWGLRDLEAVANVAAAAGFSGPIVTEMPANNLSVVFRRR